MRIGFDVSQTCASRAGCAWHADALAKSLHSLVGSENLILYHQFGNWLNGDTKDGTVIEGCLSPFLECGYEEAKRIWMRIESGEEALAGIPDVVQSNSFMAPSTGATPLVYTIHDLCFLTHPNFTTEENRRFCIQEFDNAIERASAFHFISQATLDDFNHLYPNYLETTRKPYRVIHSAPRLGSFRRTNPFFNLDAPWLFIGTIEPRKNISGLLDAFEIYLQESKRPRSLHIAGAKGWLSDSLHQRFEKMTKGGSFKYLGRVSEDELNALYCKSFAFLFPSYYEGFGLPVIEAMNHSLPVISNDIKSIREFASNAATFTKFEEPDKVAAQMMALENDEAHYRDQGLKSEETARKFNWSKTASNLLELYESAIAYSNKK